MAVSQTKVTPNNEGSQTPNSKVTRKNDLSRQSTKFSLIYICDMTYI